MLFKNIANQKLAVYAYDTDADAPETGDAANITCELSIDGGASSALGDTNPTELDTTDHPGIYIFDLTQAETNGDMLIFSPVSSTANIHTEPVIVYTDGGILAGLTAPGTSGGLVRGEDTDSLEDVASAVADNTTADSYTWEEVMTYLGAFVANNITAAGVRDKYNTKDRITASRTATTRTVTARDAT